jgi:PilZN3 domain
MNNYQIEQYALQYKENSITINPYILKKIGIIKNKSLIRVDKYQLACVPYSISLTSCRLLLILSPREQTIITGNKNGNIMLHLEFIHPNLDKKVPLFVRININKFQELNSRLNQCLLDVDLLTVPQDYKEILVEYFQKDEESRTLFSNPQKNSLTFKAKELLKYKCEKLGKLRLSNDHKLDFRIIEMGMRRLTLYIDTEMNLLENAPEKVIIEMVINGAPVFINAAQIDYTASQEVAGYFIVILELEFSLCLVDCLSKMINKELTETVKSDDLSEKSDAESEQSDTEEIKDSEDDDADDVIMEDPS